jgi:cell division protein FtsI/penicillin-binding protein 2
MGKSTNTVFARLASKHLDPTALSTTAHSLGYGAPVPFDVANEASSITLPEDKLGFARTAAGFWNTTLSPLEAAMLSATVAHEGEAMRPFVVEGAVDPKGAAILGAPDREALPRAMSKDAAAALTTMMEHTISEGTSYRAFHDPRGKAFLPGMAVAGKTGTLNDPDGKRLYSWFTGFLPAHPRPGESQVAIAVLVINRPKWHVKANVLAREMLQAWAHGAARPDTVASRTK